MKGFPVRASLKALLATLVLITFAAAKDAYAFCVYNATSTPLNVMQLYHIKGFEAKMPAKQKRGAVATAWKIPVPGIDQNAPEVPTSACCNWQTKDCNKTGKQYGTLSLQLTPMVKSERYPQCGQVDENDNVALPVQAGGWVILDPNPKYDPKKGASASNPLYQAKVFSVDGVHTKTYPCPFAPRNATWSDLIPDWSDVIAG